MSEPRIASQKFQKYATAGNNTILELGKTVAVSADSMQHQERHIASGHSFKACPARSRRGYRNRQQASIEPRAPRS